MAFGTVVRRSNAAIVPLAIGTAQRQRFHRWSPSPLLSALSKSNSVPQLQPRLLLPVHNYSSLTTGRLSADESLSRALKSAINSAAKKGGDVFPFQIKEDSYSRTSLTRKYGNETIEVSAYCYSIKRNCERIFFKLPVELLITISKNGKEVMWFKCTATGYLWKKIKIKSLKIMNGERDFSEFDYNMRCCLRDYLEARGIKSSIIKHMNKYRKNKFWNDEVKWFDDLKKIIDQ